MKWMKIALLLLSIGSLGACWELDIVPCNASNCNKTTCSHNDTICNACNKGYYIDDANNQCASCEDQIESCTDCTFASASNSTVICLGCNITLSPPLYPSNDGSDCKNCSDVIANCETCTNPNEPSELSIAQVQCTDCKSGYDLSNDHLSCQEQSSASTIIIISAVVGGVVLIGAGFAIFKCMKKKNYNKAGSEKLLEDEVDS